MKEITEDITIVTFCLTDNADFPFRDSCKEWMDRQCKKVIEDQQEMIYYKLYDGSDYE